ncbi:MAG: uncharacterized protein QOJ09_3073 [Actinomycetota bacterium]|nr:uncharacterized protein [Actinomycetota bacterium]
MLEGILDIESDGAVLLRLHVQPGAGRSAVVGRHGDALKVRVAAPPTGGRANDAVLALIADTLGVKAADVELVGGDSSRSKRVRVKGVEADDVRKNLERAVGNAGPSRDVSGPQHGGSGSRI